MRFKEWVFTESTAQVKINLPDVRQSHPYDCGPACLRSICQYYGVGPKTEDAFIKLLKTTKEGSHPKDIVKAAKDLKLNAEFHNHFTLNKLKQCLDEGKPVICEIQAWGDPKNYHKLDDGHFVIAIGYDKKNIYFEDPSLKGIRGYIPTDEFIKRWEEIESNGDHFHHSAIVIWKDSEPIQKVTNNKAEYIE